MPKLPKYDLLCRAITEYDTRSLTMTHVDTLIAVWPSETSMPDFAESLRDAVTAAVLAYVPVNVGDSLAMDALANPDLITITYTAGDDGNGCSSFGGITIDLDTFEDTNAPYNLALATMVAGVQGGVVEKEAASSFSLAVPLAFAAGALAGFALAKM